MPVYHKSSIRLRIFHFFSHLIAKLYVTLAIILPPFEAWVFGPLGNLVLRLRVWLTPGVTLEKKRVAGIPVYCFRPIDAPNQDKAILHIHGGALSFGCVGTYGGVMLRLANKTGLTIYFPEYTRYQSDHIDYNRYQIEL